MAKSSFYTRIIDISKYILPENFDKAKEKLDRLSVPEPNTGCHLWLASTDLAGYGGFCIKDKKIMAHRVAYFLYKGPIPEDFVVDHLCDNPSCVNPLHLEVKIQRDNGLRSKGSPTTINANKTHCKRGHEFNDENTYISDSGRACKICAKEYKKEWHQKNKARYSEKYKTEEWKSKNKEWRMKRYQENRDTINEKRRLRKKSKNG